MVNDDDKLEELSESPDSPPPPEPMGKLSHIPCNCRSSKNAVKCLLQRLQRVKCLYIKHINYIKEFLPLEVTSEPSIANLDEVQSTSGDEESSLPELTAPGYTSDVAAEYSNFYK